MFGSSFWPYKNEVLKVKPPQVLHQRTLLVLSTFEINLEDVIKIRLPEWFSTSLCCLCHMFPFLCYASRLQENVSGTVDRSDNTYRYLNCHRHPGTVPSSVALCVQGSPDRLQCQCTGFPHAGRNASVKGSL